MLQYDNHDADQRESLESRGVCFQSREAARGVAVILVKLSGDQGKIRVNKEPPNISDHGVRDVDRVIPPNKTFECAEVRAHDVHRHRRKFPGNEVSIHRDGIV